MRKIFQNTGDTVSEAPKYLDIIKVSRRFSITITRDVIKYLQLEQSVGKEIAFCTLENSDKIILVANKMRGGEIFLGASKLSTQNTLVVPEAVRELLKIDLGNILQFWLEPDGRISIKKTEINY